MQNASTCSQINGDEKQNGPRKILSTSCLRDRDVADGQENCAVI